MFIWSAQLNKYILLNSKFIHLDTQIHVCVKWHGIPIKFKASKMMPHVQMMWQSHSNSKSNQSRQVFKMTCLDQSQETLSHSICDKFDDLHEPIRTRQ